jgi:hypothetical protein
MLRIYFLQQWYGLADEALEDALYDSQALRGFVGIELNRDRVSDATTVLRFRHWLEQHDLTRVLFGLRRQLTASKRATTGLPQTGDRPGSGRVRSTSACMALRKQQVRSKQTNPT